MPKKPNPAKRQTLAETATIKKGPDKDPKRVADYHKYLKSDHWEELKKLVFEWRGRKCQLCMGSRNLQVHHMTYKRVGKEDPRDVLIVCDSCHKFIHSEH